VRPVPGGLLIGVAVAALVVAVAVGREALVLNGEATRSRWFVDLYTVALYAPETTTDAARILDPAVAKTLRLELHRSTPGEPDLERIPDEWRDELLPLLGDVETTLLKGIYAELGRGDVVRAEYAPETGTRLTVNNRPVLERPGSEIMDALLARLIGPDPIDAEVRDSLLGRR
jgi:hypothetical protein